MRFQIVALAAVASLASAQTTMNATAYATGLLAALASFNLTTLATVATANAATIVPLLMTGNKTVFAPTNEAFAALPAAVLSNATLVADTVLYHIVNGWWPNLTVAHTITNSSLNATGLVNLPGGAPQAVVLTGSAGVANVVQPLNTVTSTAMATYQNLVVYIIPAVLTVPTNTTGTATAANLTSLVGAISTYAPSLVPVANTYAGLTLFAPTNAAFSAISSTIATLNASVITTVLSNHVILGQALYSTKLANGLTFTTAAGETLTVINNATGVFLSELSGAVIAQVTQADVLTSNGVVHVINAVLANTMSNATAAAAAPTAASTASGTGAAASPSATKAASATTLTVGSGLALAALAFGLVL